MLPGFRLALDFRFTQLLWLLLLAGALLAFSSGRAEAEQGLASWYGPGLQGLPTASGEPFDANGYTAAHKTLPFGTMLNVTYGGRSVPVRVNDRGPYTGGRDLDLSQAAARDIGLTRVGVDYVDFNAMNGGSVTGNPNYPNSSGYPRSYPPAQPQANGGTYVVQPGDTLSQIAERLGTTTDNLAAQNGITNPNSIYSGQALYFQAPTTDQAVGGGGASGNGNYGSPMGPSSPTVP